MNVFICVRSDCSPTGCMSRSAYWQYWPPACWPTRRNWQLPFFRITCLAVLMGYVILFSNSSEGHTYVIMLIGYQMWYWTMRRGGAIRLADRIAYWATLVIVVVMPVDILCPPKVMQLFYGWQLNLWLLLFLWLRMCWTAFIRIPEPMKRVGAA